MQVKERVLTTFCCPEILTQPRTWGNHPSTRTGPSIGTAVFRQTEDSSASPSESCILSTDLRQFSIFLISCCEPDSFIRFAPGLSCRELASSMELMSYNIRTNTALYPNCPPMALPPDWGDEELSELVRYIRERGRFDLIVLADTYAPLNALISGLDEAHTSFPSIPPSHVHVPPHRMADVAYNTSPFPALLRMLSSLLALSNNAQSNYRDDDPGSGSSQGRE
jgi:hypothetical protein